MKSSFASIWRLAFGIRRFAVLAALGLAVAAVGETADTVPASQPSIAARVRVAELSRHAADLIEHRQFPQAEQTLNQALAIDLQNTTCLYNLAAVHAAMGRDQQAVEDLTRATDAGFTDFSLISHNAAFDRLTFAPKFQALLARKDQIVHHAGELIVAQLKVQFGNRYLYRVDEPHKLVIVADVDQAEIDRIIDELHTELASEEANIFSHPPDEFIKVIVASSIDFAKQEHRYDVGGRYDDSMRTLIVKADGFALRHEFTHALHAADQHALEQEHPIWLSEGLAVLFEQPRTEDGKMLPGENWRLARVQAVAKNDALIPIEKLVKMDRIAFTDRAELAYGEAGSLLMYLYQQHQLKSFYDAYTAGYAKDPTGITALNSVTGESTAVLQKHWTQWLVDQAAPPAPEKSQ